MPNYLIAKSRLVSLVFWTLFSLLLSSHFQAHTPFLTYPSIMSFTGAAPSSFPFPFPPPPSTAIPPAGGLPEIPFNINPSVFRRYAIAWLTIVIFDTVRLSFSLTFRSLNRGNRNWSSRFLRRQTVLHLPWRVQTYLES